MSQHLNRLNDKEALEWDRAHERFCETGQWENEMNAFKRWWRRVYIDGFAKFVTPYDSAKAAWKEALKWNVKMIEGEIGEEPEDETD